VHQGMERLKFFKTIQMCSFSTHGKTNYPFKKEISDLDIAFDDGTDDAFLKLLAIIPKLIETQNLISSFI
jgi:hypothetical protein